MVDIDEIQFRYEVVGESVPEICRDLGIFVKDLEALVKQESWVHVAPPGRDATEEEVNTYYKLNRMRLTTQMTRRAIKMFPRLTKIEDAVVDAIDNTLTSYNADKPEASANLARIVNAYSKLLDKQALLHEAIATPALVDKKLESLLKDTALSDILNALDGKGRNLPSEDPRV